MRHFKFTPIKKTCKDMLTSLWAFLIKVVFNRLILMLSIPFILINVLCAIVILIKNWSINITQELNV